VAIDRRQQHPNRQLNLDANGTLWQMAIADTANSGNTQTCTYGYDDLERLLSANCGTPWGQTFAYDRFGNIWKYGSSGFSQGYQGGNRVTGFSHDNMGNVTNDGANTYTYDAEGRQITVNGNATTLDALTGQFRFRVAALIPKSCILRAVRSSPS
jgi:hypothetical protein